MYFTQCSTESSFTAVVFKLELEVNTTDLTNLMYNCLGKFCYLSINYGITHL